MQIFVKCAPVADVMRLPGALLLVTYIQATPSPSLHLGVSVFVIVPKNKWQIVKGKTACRLTCELGNCAKEQKQL